MSATETVIEPTTAAVTAVKQLKLTRTPLTITASGLASAETVDVYFSVDGGISWELLYLNGSQVRLNATNKAVSLYSPLLLGVTKTATAAASGVFQN